MKNIDVRFRSGCEDVTYRGKHRVAAVQAAPVWLDMDATIEKSIKLMKEAHEQKAELIAFPELWIPGYPYFIYTKSCSAWPSLFLQKYHENSICVDSAQIRRIQEAARKYEIIVVMGISEREGGTRYMSQVIIDENGELLGVRRKFKPTFVERTIFGEGDGSDFRVFNTKIGRVGALNCWEHMQPLVKYTMLSLSEQIHIGSWPAITQPDVPAYGLRTQDTISRMYAMETQTFMLSTSQVVDEMAQNMMAHTDEERGWLHMGGGATRIYAPNGDDLAVPLESDEEGIICADIDLADILGMKGSIDQVGHYSKRSIFTLLVDDTPLRSVKFASEDSDFGKKEADVKFKDAVVCTYEDKRAKEAEEA